MQPKAAQYNTLMLELEELFLDPISNQTLSCPRLLGKHTFSSQTINKLTKFYDDDGCQYIYQPYTREKFYINTAKDLPRNILIEDLYLIYAYCRKFIHDNQDFNNTISYFIKLFSGDHERLNEIEDILLKKILELLNIDKKSIFKTPSNACFNRVLFMAIKYNKNRLINLLLLQDITINVELKDKQGKTSFFWACYYNNIKIAQKLKDLGADIYVRDKKNKSPFLSRPQLFWHYHHKRYLNKQNIQQEVSELAPALDEWTLVVSKHYRRDNRLHNIT